MLNVIYIFSCGIYYSLFPEIAHLSELNMKYLHLYCLLIHCDVPSSFQVVMTDCLRSIGLVGGISEK